MTQQHQKNANKATAHFPHLLADRPLPCIENLSYLICKETHIELINNRFHLFFEDRLCALLSNPDDAYFEFINFKKESSLYKRVLSSLAKHKFYAPVRTANFLTEINQNFICDLIDRAKGVSHE